MDEEQLEQLKKQILKKFHDQYEYERKNLMARFLAVHSVGGNTIEPFYRAEERTVKLFVEVFGENSPAYYVRGEDLCPDWRGSFEEGKTYAECWRDGSLKVVDDSEGQTFGMRGHLYYE